MGFTEVHGYMGAGKTLFLTSLAYLHPERQYVANYNIDLPNVKEFSINKFLKAEYENCSLLLDEIYSYIDARRHESNLNLNFGYLLFQSRKKGVQIYSTEQLRRTIDIRYRELTDFCVWCKQLKNGFQYYLYKPQNPDWGKYRILSLEQASKLFPLYDTNQLILPPSMTRSATLYLTNEEREELAEKITPQIWKDFKSIKKNKRKNNITKGFLRYWLNNHPDYDVSIAQFMKDYIDSHDFQTKS